MELYQLKTFIAVAEEEHLTRAAERLAASQPAVSAQIKALEDELGLNLFERKPKGMKLTRAGATLKEQAAKVLHDVDELLFLARSMVGELSGSVMVGLNSASDFLKTAALYTMLQGSHPKLKVHFTQGISGGILRDVRSGRLDCGYIFGNTTLAENVAGITLGTYQLVIVAPKLWQDEVGRADWEALATFPWVWVSQDCAWRGLIENEFSQRGLWPTAAAYTDTETAMKALVEAGAGMGIMLEDEAIEAEAAGKVAVWGGQKFPIELSFVYLKGRKTDPVMLALINAVEQLWSKE